MDYIYMEYIYRERDIAIIFINALHIYMLLFTPY